MMKILNQEEQDRRKNRNILLAEIHSTRNSMFAAEQKFEHATDPQMIDCCIYEMNAAQLRYQYLIDKAKKIGLTDLPKLRYTVQTVWK